MFYVSSGMYFNRSVYPVVDDIRLYLGGHLEFLDAPLTKKTRIVNSKGNRHFKRIRLLKMTFFSRYDMHVFWHQNKLVSI